jgi:nucleotide-binding universal stress UspA family protein
MSSPDQRRIVVGVDGTLASDEACSMACTQAVERCLPLRVLHAWLPGSVYLDGQTKAPPIWGSETAVLAAAQEVLARAAELVATRMPTGGHEEVLLQAATDDALVRASRDAELLVLGGRERGRHHLPMGGSVPLHVVPRALCPVLVVPTDPRTDGDIVVGVDGSGLAEAVVALAFAEAARTGARVRAVMAAEGRPDAGQLLEQVVAKSRAEHPDVQASEFLSDDSPSRALRAAAEDAGLLVLGSHGRGVVRRYALGSVSWDLLRSASCPVLLLGPDVQR